MNRSLERSVLFYKEKFEIVWNGIGLQNLENLVEDLLLAWKNQTNVFLCGNGGSATNANHIANDLIYGINPKGRGIRANSLCANESIMTCLANDTGYENIFGKQLYTLGNPGDYLITFSGSGNSENLVEALKIAKKMKIKTHAIVGFDGGHCAKLAENCIHFKINHMQISEDFQTIIFHMLILRIKDEIEQ